MGTLKKGNHIRLLTTRCWLSLSTPIIIISLNNNPLFFVTTKPNSFLNSLTFQIKKPRRRSNTQGVERPSSFSHTLNEYTTAATSPNNYSKSHTKEEWIILKKQGFYTTWAILCEIVKSQFIANFWKKFTRLKSKSYPRTSSSFSFLIIHCVRLVSLFGSS
jgi:hypothetical protein